MVRPYAEHEFMFGGIHRTAFFCKGVFHHPVWFVCFVGVFYITPFDADLIGLLWVFASLEGLGDLF